MSKFKVGDKVWCNGDVKVIKRVDEWEDGEYGYYFNVDDELLDYYREEDLELYKTPHERLLELGWIIDKDDTNPANLEFYYNDNKVLIIDKVLKEVKTLYAIDLQLAEILIDYLKELENET